MEGAPRGRPDQRGCLPRPRCRTNGDRIDSIAIRRTRRCNGSSLADIDSALAFELARVYGQQQIYTSLTGGLMQAMYLRPPSENLTAFLHSVKIYLDDIVEFDPGLVKMYDEVLPLIDRALKD